MGFIFLCPRFRLLFAFASSCRKESRRLLFLPGCCHENQTKSTHKANKKVFFVLRNNTSKFSFLSKDLEHVLRWRALFWKAMIGMCVDINRIPPELPFVAALYLIMKRQQRNLSGNSSALFPAISSQNWLHHQGWVRMWGYVTFFEEGHWNSWNSSTS